MFKTSGGKYIAPQVIENQLKQSLLIEQIIVVGEGKNMPSALIQPCFEQALIWFKEQEFHVKTIKIPYVKMKNYWKKSMMKSGCMIRNSVNGSK